MKNEPPESEARDALAQLLAKAGPRLSPPARVEAEVRAAVHAEWQHLVQQKQTRRRWLAIAATLVMVVGAGWLARELNPAAPGLAPSGTVIARVEHLQGEVMLNDQRVTESAVIRAGDTLTTIAGGVRIQLHNGITLRIAADSTLQWREVDQAELRQGRIYVDSHDNVAPLVLQTPLGSVTHLGTRYLVDAQGQSLRVAVREGQASIRSNDAQLTVNAMQQVQMSADRQIIRADLLPDDPAWQWAAALGEPFVLDNRSVADFLHWVAEETGYELHYASTAIRTAAEQTVLHGRQTQVAPLQALQSVLAATDFRATTQGRLLQITQSH